MSPVSLSYWGVPGYLIFWILFIIAVALFLSRAYKLWRLVSLGKRWESLTSVPARLWRALGRVAGQMCQFRALSSKDFAGGGHVLMAWGFFIFVIYYFIFIIIGAGFGISGTLEDSSFFYYYSWVMDIAAPLVILAAAWGIIRRYIIRPPRLKGEQTFEALVILVTVLIHPLTHLFKEATSIALGQPPAGLSSALPAVSLSLSKLFEGASLSSINSAYVGFFWTHWIVVLFVLVFIAYSRYLHVIAAPFNILLRPSRPPGSLEPVDFKANEAFGVTSVKDFTRKQLLESLSCVVCGRCQDACPAHATGKPLNPKKVLQEVKQNLLEQGPALLEGKPAADNPGKTLAGGLISNEELWDCTTCGACIESCPVENYHPGVIVELRRKLVYEGVFDKGHQRALERVAQDFNPWGIRWNQRARNIGIDEAKTGEKYDCIYWLGCVASFDERSREVAQATARILRAAGIKFAILGTKEKCCGDFVRRIGDEGLFQKLAGENIATLRAYDFDFILTHCPHCFNTLKNEYPDFGGKFKVVHHVQLIDALLKEGKIRLQESSGQNVDRIMYHDPCYLGRYNGIYDEPRDVLRHVPGTVVEFPRNRENSFCCGGGGGHAWIEEETGSRISVARLDEALKSQPQSLVTSCPFCFLMFQEAIQLSGKTADIALKDIAEIVERYLP